MGYDVSGSGEITIPAQNIEAAYGAILDLNRLSDDAKRGGSWKEGERVSSHFSWMPADLSEFKSLNSLLEALGFECAVEKDGVTVLNYPNSKTGQEEVFFAAIAPYVESGGYMFWDGEDGAYWKWTFVDGQMFEHEGIREYSDGTPVTIATYVQGQLAMYEAVHDMFKLATKTEG